MNRPKVIVINASRYKIVDQKTGEINQGTTVRFVNSDNLEPCQLPDNKGYRLGKASLGYDEYDLFKVVPGVYTADYDISIAGDGTMKVKASNFEYVGPLSQPAAK